MKKEELKLEHLCFYLHRKLKMICKGGEGEHAFEVVGELVAIDVEGLNGVNPLKVKYYSSCKAIPMYAGFSFEDVTPILSCAFTSDNFDNFDLIKKGLAINEKDNEN